MEAATAAPARPTTAAATEKRMLMGGIKVVVVVVGGVCWCGWRWENEWNRCEAGECE